jgi:tetratricopeptide (TPR) repeat protein
MKKHHDRRAPPERSTWSRDAAIAGVLFLLVWAAFAPVLQNGFIDYDDPDYITENVHVRAGLTWQNIQWAFRDTQQAGFWHPLTWLSHMLDCQWFGLHAAGHHAVSVVLHGLSVALLFVVLRRMTGAVWRSAALAALFGVHPLRVESVAWAAERKDVLATLFCVLTVGAYACAVRAGPTSDPAGPSSKRKVYYGLALVFFICGLMSKPMLVTLPCVLLLVDFWPLNRISNLGFSGQPGTGRVTLFKLVCEKIPFFLAATGVSVGTFLAQQASSATSVGVPFAARLENALVAYIRYLGKLLIPANLACFYPHPGFWPMWAVAGSALLLGLISIVAIRRRRILPWLFVGWFWFVGTLVPVIGLIQVGEQAMADRFVYVPSIGVLLIVVWGGWEVVRTFRWRPALAAVPAGVCVVALIVATREQVTYWKNSETLFQHALAVTRDNHVAHLCLGIAYEQAGRVDEAVSEYEAVLALKPDYAVAHNNIGFALTQRGRFDEARAHLERALTLGADPARVRFGLGLIFGRENRVAEAIVAFQEAARLRPDWPQAHYNLGIALERGGRTAEAADAFQRAAAWEPESPEYHFAWGRALSRLNRGDQAIAQFGRALELRPVWAECRVNLGNALARAGHLEEAIAQFRQAVEQKPDLADAHNNLGLALRMQGARDEAIKEFRTALDLDPADADARRNLAETAAQGK